MLLWRWRRLLLTGGPPGSSVRRSVPPQPLVPREPLRLLGPSGQAPSSGSPSQECQPVCSTSQAMSPYPA